MIVRMLVEDRDLAYIFTDVDNAPIGARLVQVHVPHPASLKDAENDDKFIWIEEEDDVYRVYHQIPFGDWVDRGHQIPNPVVMGDVTEYKRSLAE